ncbi:MAG: hypothetical protein HYR55_05005 [Acidobacteria bacterium]|nr:hypothetical protein [Acidobacteriota bacterium]
MDKSPPRKKDYTLTQEAFDALLQALDADPARAAESYEVLRQGLIRNLRRWSCQWPESIADKAIDRGAQKIIQGEKINNIPAFFRRVAYLVWLDVARESKEQPLIGDESQFPDPPAEDHTERERRIACMEHCLWELRPESRALVIEYYQGQGRTQAEARKIMAARLKTTLCNLTLRVHRIRVNLEECVTKCLEREGYAK